MADRLRAGGIPKTVEATVRMTPLLIAEAFAEMDDEGQAQFFIEVAAIAATWGGDVQVGRQWTLVGAHLRDCACATEEARDMVRSIAYPIRETVATTA